MKYSFLFYLAFLLHGCIKEKVGHTKSFINNTTAHTIKLLPYYGSVLDNSNIKIISSNSIVEVLDMNVRGKTIEPSFGILLQPYDSVLVTYDDVVKIPHIKFNLPYPGNHYIPITSNRSISNQNN